MCHTKNSKFNTADFLSGKSKRIYPHRNHSLNVTINLNITRITYLIGFLIFPFLIYGQEVNSELKNEINKIDSIIQLTNSTDKNYSEGIAEGPIIYNSLFKKMEVGMPISCIRI